VETQVTQFLNMQLLSGSSCCSSWCISYPNICWSYQGNSYYQ